jgi:hypothetical protein
MSKKKDRPFKILIIDDDVPYVEALYRDAQEYRLILTPFGNLESAREFLNSSEGVSISGVILDVVCMKDKDQEIPNPDFIMTAIKFFNEKFSHLPLVILTGEPDRFKHLKEYFKGVLPTYSKGRDEAEMLLFLKDKAQEIPREKIIRRYLDVFEVVEQYLGYEAEERLLDCLNKMGQPEPSIITGTLGNLRKLQEYLYLGLNKIDNNMVPDALIYSGKTKVDNEKIIRHLKGNFDKTNMRITTTEYVIHNSQADRLLNYIYRGCSEEIHVTEQNTTKYTVQSLVFAFIDLVLWLKEIAEKNR